LNALQAAELAVIGVAAGALGTIVGLGGGFVVIPILRLAYGVAPATTAGISLVMVLANAISGSVAYLRQGRADVRLALLVAATGIPASILGAFVVHRASVVSFDLLYAGLLVYFALDILRRRNDPANRGAIRVPGLKERTLTDSSGAVFRYSTSTPLVLLCGLILGFTSSFFGIGGGAVFVIFFIAMFAMPTHIVTATSTLAILLTAPVGVASHAYAGDVDWGFALPLAFGALVGGQVGPKIARRMTPSKILLLLACAMLITAASLVARELFHR
jgi:uncharacterized membrane protein YfcA